MRDIKVKYVKRDLQFLKPSGTSRGILTSKPSYFIQLTEGEKKGYGECSLIPGLSPDNEGMIINILNALQYGLAKLDQIKEESKKVPALHFAIEMAMIQLEKGMPGIYFPSAFTEGKEQLTINGLIWMGAAEEMLEQIQEKCRLGFHCVKLKIGAIDFDNELSLLREIRQRYDARQIELRVDANGAFSPEEAEHKLKSLSQFDIHSIEQPIAPGQWDAMKQLAQKEIIPIALDEELIGITDLNRKEELISTINPQYIILKPSLLGGFNASDEWIQIAERSGIKWWSTSALESNVGLTAIAQWAASKNVDIPQGLGTGQLFSNNTTSPLKLEVDRLHFNPLSDWAMQIEKMFEWDLS